MSQVFSWIWSVSSWEIFILTTRRKRLNKKYFFLQYQFTNRVSEDNAELEEEDSGIYWTQDEGAPEDNPGRPVSLKHDWHRDLGIHRTLSRSHFNHTHWCNSQSNEIQAELKESTVSGWQTVDSWRSSFPFPLMLLDVSPSHCHANWCHVLMCSFDRCPTMLMASPALSPLSLIRMDIHQSLITRPIKLLKQFFLALKNVLENNDKLFVFQY